MSRQKRQQRRNKHQQPDPAQRFRNWRNYFTRAEPANPQPGGEYRQQESAHTEKLQDQVCAIGADYADPITCGTRSSQYRRAVQRRIERRIGTQRKEKEERRYTQQEPQQL